MNQVKTFEPLADQPFGFSAKTGDRLDVEYVVYLTEKISDIQARMHNGDEVAKHIEVGIWEEHASDDIAYPLEEFVGFTEDGYGLIFRGELPLNEEGVFYFTVRSRVIRDESSGKKEDHYENGFVYHNRSYNAYWIAVLSHTLKTSQNGHEQWTADDIYEVIKSLIMLDGDKWAKYLYEFYKSSEANREAIVTVIRKLLFDNNRETRKGAAWIISHDEFMGPVEHPGLDGWPSDERTILNVMERLEYSGGIIVDFMRGLASDERRQWAMDQVISVLAKEGRQGYMYQRALYIMGFDLTPLNVGRYDGTKLYPAMRDDLLQVGDEGKVAYTKEDPFDVSLRVRDLGTEPHVKINVRTKDAQQDDFEINNAQELHACCRW